MKVQTSRVGYPARCLAVIATGVVAGLAGMALALILHAIQHFNQVRGINAFKLHACRDHDHSCAAADNYGCAGVALRA